MNSLNYLGAGLALLFGLVAVYLLLPKVRERLALPLGLAGLESAVRGAFAFLDKHRLKIGIPSGVIALALAGVFLLAADVRSVENVLFYLFSGIGLVGGVLLITQRNPARAAVSFVAVVLSTCGLFLILGAPFLMAGTAIVYAGAIVVTFLFVLMLAQQSGPSDADHRSREPLLACVAGFVLLGGLLYLIQASFATEDLDVLLAEAGRLESRIDEVKTSQEANPQTAELVKQSLAIAADVKAYLEKLKAWEAAHEPGDAPVEFLNTPEVRLRRAREAIGPVNGELIREAEARPPNPGEVLEALGKLEGSVHHLLREGADIRASVGQLVPPTKWVVTDLTLESLRRENVSESALINLAPLKNRVYGSRDHFASELRGALTGENLDRYQDVIMSHAARSQLSDLSGPPPNLAAQDRRVDGFGRPLQPAENTAYLGRSLFSDYLVPVGAAGVLLLVATVGAVAIAMRQPGRTV